MRELEEVVSLIKGLSYNECKILRSSPWCCVLNQKQNIKPNSMSENTLGSSCTVVYYDHCVDVMLQIYLKLHKSLSVLGYWLFVQLKLHAGVQNTAGK